MNKNFLVLMPLWLKLNVTKPKQKGFFSMAKPRRIYLLSPKEYSPETIAVAFAKTSRSPQPFDEIAAELNDESSARFHEKWVVGYGHSSVAEHAVLHLALENISRLAIETIEANRLASYTEKSTRYQLWDKDAFYLPDELVGSPFEADYSRLCRRLFETYLQCIQPVKAWLKDTMPRAEGESESAYERRIAPAAVDIGRFLLPAASLANVGITINARALEYAICKLLSSPLEEVRAIGERLREVGQLETPTLIKYAACNEYLRAVEAKMMQQARLIAELVDDLQDFSMLAWDPDGQERILAAVLFRFGHQADYQHCYDHVVSLSAEQKARLSAELMADRGPFDQPLREFEYAQMSFEAVMDQGAYFEFKRHRMMTQTVQPLTASLGFAVPKGITASGCEAAYLDVMRQAAMLYDQIKKDNPAVASYVIPNGFNRRVLFTMNLRQVFHFCRLRGAENAHFSIRRAAYRLAEAVKKVYPLLGAYLDLPSDASWRSIEDQFFSMVNSR
jgi:thymidylate synthase ThyX